MENKKLILSLDIQKINTIISGLGELQAKITFDLINEIHYQVNKQLKEQDNNSSVPTLQ